MEIRQATQADLQALSSIIEHSPVREAEGVRLFFEAAEALGEREELWVVAQPELRGAGLVKRYSPRGGYRFCAEVFLYIAPSHRQNGWGLKVQEALLERARRLEYHHVLARVWGDDAASLACFEKAGYERVGVQREIGWREDGWVDMVVFQKVLESNLPA